MPKLTKISASIMKPDVGISKDGRRRFNSMNIDSDKRIPRQPMLDVHSFKGKHFQTSITVYDKKIMLLILILYNSKHHHKIYYSSK
jgi:hypothetical protein